LKEIHKSFVCNFWVENFFLLFNETSFILFEDLINAIYLYIKFLIIIDLFIHTKLGFNNPNSWCMGRIWLLESFWLKCCLLFEKPNSRSIIICITVSTLILFKSVYSYRKKHIMDYNQIQSFLKQCITIIITICTLFPTALRCQQLQSNKQLALYNKQ